MLQAREEGLSSGVRQQNLAVVTGWLESARAGRGSAGLITGRSGMGKTVLARQLTLVARHLECLAITASGRGRDAAPMVAGQIAEQLRLAPAASDALLLRAIRDELRRLGSQGRCVLLVFEDLHSLTPADIAVVEDLAVFPPTPRMLVLLTLRAGVEVEPGEPHLRLLEQLEAGRNLEVLTLEPMSESEAAPLVSSGFPPGAVTPRFIRDAVAFTGGNPQWIDSLVRETLKLPEFERAALLTGSQLLSEARMPASITRAVEFRVAGLGEARGVADALAVWGEPASIETLATLLGRPADEVERGIERLERVGLVQAGDSSSPLVTYEFTEPIVAAALRTLMPRSTQSRLQRAALHLSRDEVASPERPVLATRYLEAAEVLGVSEIEAVLAAARKHIEHSRYEAARSLLARLVERLEASKYPVPAEAMVLLAESHSRAGAFEEAARILEDVSEGDVEQERRRVMRAARDAVAIGFDADALSMYETLLADETLEPIERARVLMDAARIEAQLGRPDVSRLHRDSAAQFAEQGGDMGMAGIARLESMLVLWARARHVPLREVSRAFGQAWASRTRGTSARATSNVAYILQDCTTLDRAVRWWRRASRLAERDDDYAALSAIALALGRVEIELGEWERAERTIATAVQVDASLHRTRALRGSRALQSMLSALRGQTGHLDLQLGETFRVAERFGGPHVSLLDFLARFEHRMRLEDYEEAADPLNRAERMLLEVDGYERLLLVDVLPRAALLHFRTRDSERLDSVITSFEGFAEQSGRTLPVLRPLSYQMQAYRAWLREDPARAADLAAAAADRFDALGYRWRAAVVHRDSAEANREAGFTQEARIQFEAAFRLFGQIGALEQLAAVRSELVGLGVRAKRTTQRRSALTARQWQIAELAARGLSDPQIAEALGISKRTASTHMHHILSALGLQSRVQLGTWTASHQQDRARALGDMM